MYGHINGHLDKLLQAGPSGAAKMQLDALTTLVAVKVAEIEQVVAQNRRGEVNATIVRVTSGRCKLLIDSIRTETAGSMQIGHSSLARQELLAQDRTHHLFFVMVSAIPASTAFEFLTI
jgi:CHASE3 domain sensor protein